MSRIVTCLDCPLYQKGGYYVKAERPITVIEEL